MIERSITVPVELTPEELASEFCGMDDTNQAAFFNAVHTITEKWDHPLCFQLQWVTDNSILTDGARRVMAEIGEYSQLKERTK